MFHIKESCYLNLEDKLTICGVVSIPTYIYRYHSFRHFEAIKTLYKVLPKICSSAADRRCMIIVVAVSKSKLKTL